MFQGCLLQEGDGDPAQGGADTAHVTKLKEDSFQVETFFFNTACTYPT